MISASKQLTFLCLWSHLEELVFLLLGALLPQWMALTQETSTAQKIATAKLEIAGHRAQTDGEIAEYATFYCASQ